MSFQPKQGVVYAIISDQSPVYDLVDSLKRPEDQVLYSHLDTSNISTFSIYLSSAVCRLSSVTKFVQNCRHHNATVAIIADMSLIDKEMEVYTEIAQYWIFDQVDSATTFLKHFNHFDQHEMKIITDKITQTLKQGYCVFNTQTYETAALAKANRTIAPKMPLVTSPTSATTSSLTAGKGHLLMSNPIQQNCRTVAIETDVAGCRSKISIDEHGRKLKLNLKFETSSEINPIDYIIYSNARGDIPLKWTAIEMEKKTLHGWFYSTVMYHWNLEIPTSERGTLTIIWNPKLLPDISNLWAELFMLHCVQN